MLTLTSGNSAYQFGSLLVTAASTTVNISLVKFPRDSECSVQHLACKFPVTVNVVFNISLVKFPRDSECSVQQKMATLA
jgi:hypothetical protein